MLTIKLTNAARLAREHPGSFARPGAAELRGLKPGDVVKVCDKPQCSNGQIPERFWVILKEPVKGGWSAEINNDLIDETKLYNAGTVIRVKPEHIYAVFVEAKVEELLSRTQAARRVRPDTSTVH